jgi:glycosyltransferase involved in cell wall biosynthesis
MQPSTEPLVGPSWTIILPFYNEEEAIEDAIVSLSYQTDAFVLLLVDNGSTDRSVRKAITACRNWGIDFHLISEPRPGKVSALNAGLRQAATIYVATCDADTYYPPDYLEHARHLLANGAAMAGAWFMSRSASSFRRLLRNLHLAVAACLLSKQCLTGGAGQAFRREALVAVGGFDPNLWDLVLEDHEICHRLIRLGPIGYHRGFWCDPSGRLRNRPTTRWALIERLLYHASVSRFGDWFFYRFLKPRLETRRLVSAALREVAS